LTTPEEIAALFVRSDSIYKSLPGVDCWDAERNALNWPGGCPVVAHPPCRGWGTLRAFAKATEEEKALGPWAVQQVRRWGGALEHPARSSLWKYCDLPRPGDLDSVGGFTIDLDQFWFGHRAQKRTWVYVCGCRPMDIPAWPIRLGKAPRVVTNLPGLRKGMRGFRTEITKRERDASPPAFAVWLVELARKCRNVSATCGRKGGT
jgi:hypothetical protein